MNTIPPLTWGVKTPENWPQPPDDAAYYGLAGDIVRAIEPHTEADLVAMLIQLMVAFGNVVGRSAYFVADGARHHTNLYVAVVGQSSKARKGTSWAQARRGLEAIDPDWVKERNVCNLSSGEGLIWAVRDPIEGKVPLKDKGNPTGKYADVIIDHGVEDKRLMVVESELAAVMQVMRRDGNTLSATIRQAWDSGNLRIMTKNNAAISTEAHISIIGHITIEELQRTLNETEAANGFANRFLWIAAHRSKLLPEGGRIQDVDFRPLIIRLHAAVEFACHAGKLHRDEEAHELWLSVYRDLSEGKPGLVGAVTARAEAQVMRLACLYALLDCSPKILFPHLHAALALWDYAERSAHYIFGDSLGDPMADTILRALRLAAPFPPFGMNRTDIFGLFGRNPSVARMNVALDLLVTAGLARCERQPPEGGTGRPVEMWFATPTK